MTLFLIKRLLQALFVVLAVTLIVSEETGIVSMARNISIPMASGGLAHG